MDVYIHVEIGGHPSNWTTSNTLAIISSRRLYTIQMIYHQEKTCHLGQLIISFFLIFHQKKGRVPSFDQKSSSKTQFNGRPNPLYMSSHFLYISFLSLCCVTCFFFFFYNFLYRSVRDTSPFTKLLKKKKREGPYWFSDLFMSGMCSVTVTPPPFPNGFDVGKLLNMNERFSWENLSYIIPTYYSARAAGRISKLLSDCASLNDVYQECSV